MSPLPQPVPHLGRRRFLALGVGAVGAAALAACSSGGGSAAPVTATDAASTSAGEGSSPGTGATAEPTAAPVTTASAVSEAPIPTDIYTAETTIPPAPTDPPRQKGLPKNGPAKIGDVELPNGTVEVDVDGFELLWATDEPVKDPAVLWHRLYEIHGDTGLYPIILFDDDRGRAWQAEVLYLDHPTKVLTFDPAEVLKSFGDMKTPKVDVGGLAPSGEEPSTPVDVAAAAAQVPGARIGLVATKTGAEALAFMGWLGCAIYYGAEEVISIFRSWEERYGAIVAGAGPASVSLIITKPPTDDAAAAVAAEITLVDPDMADTSLVPKNTDLSKLTTATVWTLTYP